MKKLITYSFIIILAAAFTSCSKEKSMDDFNAEDNTMHGDDSFFMLPMAITPNRDHINDEYMLFNCSENGHNDAVTSFHLEIKKNNKKVYATTDINFRWNGNDASGNYVSGITDVKVKIGINGKNAKQYNPGLYIIRDNCVPNPFNDFLFADMIDARYGAIYNTLETFCP